MGFRTWCFIVLLTIGLTAQAPVLSEVQSLNVIIVQLNERIVALQNELTRLQLILDKQQRTPPPKDGYVWNWQLNSDTQQPIGYIKAPPETAQTK